MRAPIIFIALLSAATPCLGDFYAYTDDEGTTCFTDRPTDGGAKLILRERRKQEKEHRSSQQRRESAAQPPSPAPAGDLRLPVQGKISSHPGLRHDPIDGSLRMHAGVDIAVPSGTEVRPVEPGLVTFSGSRGGYGNMVVIDHGDGLVTVYAHNSLNVAREGDRVGESSVVALSGATGRCTGPHLHFEAWRNGENITRLYAGEGEGRSFVSVGGHEAVRRHVDADGTLVFSNLP